MTLRQYIDAFVADGTFRSVPERFLLATELVYALTDEINEKTVVGTQAVFLNPDNIELTEVQDDESEVKAYAVGFSLAETDKQKLFANYGYAVVCYKAFAWQTSYGDGARSGADLGKVDCLRRKDVGYLAV